MAKPFAQVKDDAERGFKLGLIIVVSLLVLCAASIACFILFSSWREQVLFSVLGSVVSSALGIAALFFFLALLEPSFRKRRFYRVLSASPEERLTAEVKSAPSQKETVRRGIACHLVSVEGRDLYLIPDAEETLVEGKTYDLVIQGEFIVEANEHEA